jgi:hypothetical protein
MITRLRLISIICFVVAASSAGVWLFLPVPVPDPHHVHRTTGLGVAGTISAVTCAVSTITAISTMLLAWRVDRRQQREFELKVANSQRSKRKRT